jgi:hypothetical protein
MADITTSAFSPSPADNAGTWADCTRSDTALITHPRFDEAMASAARALVSFYRDSWLLNRIVNDHGRVVSALIMMDLHLNGGGGGFTVAQLREQVARHRVCSPNRATALAALLGVSGCLRAVPAQDSRMRRLAPTDSFIKLHQDRLRGTLSANSIVNPDLTKAMPLVDDEALLGDVVRAYLAFCRSGGCATGGQPGLGAIMERDAGFTILCLLLTGASHNVGYRVSDLARWFAVSRTHALGITRLGMDHGFIEQPVSGGPYIATSHLIRTMRLTFAALFQAQAEAIRLALRRGEAQAIAATA